MRISKHILFLFVFISSFNGYSKKIDFIALSEINQWEKLIEVCQQKNQPVFLMITEYKEKVNSVLEFNKNKAGVKFVNNNFVSVRVSSYSTLGQTFVSLFGLDNAGKFLIFNPHEIIMLKGDSVSLAWFNKGLTRFNNYSNLLSKYQNQEFTQTDWLEYLDISFYNLGYEKSLRDANYFTLTLSDSDLSKPELWDFILNYCTDLNNVVFRTLKNNPQVVESSEKKFPWKRYYTNCYNLNLTFAINNKDSLRMARMRTDLVPLFPDSTKQEEQKLVIGQQFYGNLKQWKYYEDVTLDYLNTFAQDSAELYLDEASKLYNHFKFNEVDDLIIEFLEKGIEIENTYDLQMSLANVYIINKDYAMALNHANQALKNSKTEKQKRSALNLIDYLITAGYY